MHDNKIMNDKIARDFWKRVEIAQGGISLKDLCLSADLNYDSVRNRKSGLTYSLPRLESALAIARALGVSMEYLLTGESSQEPALSPRVQALALKMEELTDVQLDVIEAAIEASMKKDFSNSTGRNTI